MPKGRYGQEVKYTLAQAKAILRPLDIILTKTDGEYRVNFLGAGEGPASYADDIEDAVGTGLAMAKEGFKGEYRKGFKR